MFEVDPIGWTVLGQVLFGRQAWFLMLTFRSIGHRCTLWAPGRRGRQRWEAAGAPTQEPEYAEEATTASGGQW